MFERLKERFSKGYIRLDQLRRYCELSVITKEEFFEISGKEY